MPLPGYVAQRALDYQWAFSTKKQTDYETPLQDQDLTLSHPLREISPFEITKEIRSDRDTFGKGHEFPTSVWTVALDTRVSRRVYGSSMFLGWVLSFAMGHVTTTSVGSGAYLHTIRFFNPQTTGSPQPPVTTIVERVSAGIRYKIESIAINSVTISGEGFETLDVSFEAIGSGKITSTTLSMPSIPSGLAYLASNYATIRLGDAQENLTTRIRSWSVTINNDLRAERGYFPSSGLYRGRIEIGTRSIVPSLVVDLDSSSDILSDFLNEVKCALEIYCEGPVITGSYKHYLRFRFPSLYYRAIPIEERDGVLTYAVSFDESTVIYLPNDTPNPVVTVEVMNTTASYLA